MNFGYPLLPRLAEQLQVRMMSNYSDGTDAHEAGPETSGYDVFISYSRRDIVFARALERALSRYRPPKDLAVPQRPLRVFRDEEDFTGGDYATAIRRHISAARRLVVICSPAAYASGYVNEEIRLFAEARGRDAIIPVLISGLANNEVPPGREQEAAFPPALAETLVMPLAADYRGQDPQRPRVDRGGFEGPWHKLLADLYGVERRDVEQREKRRRTQTRRAWTIGSGVVMAVLLATTIYALVLRAEAIRQREVATGGLLAIEARGLSGPEPEVAERQGLLATEAGRMLQENGGDQAEALAVLSASLGRLPRTIHTFPAQESRPSLAFSGDGLRLFRVVDERIEVWSLAELQAEPPITLSRRVVSLVSTANARWLAAIDEGGGASLHYVGGPVIGEDQPPARHVLTEQGARCPTFNPEGTHFAALIEPRSGPLEVAIWRVSDGRKRARLVLPRNIDLPVSRLPCLGLGKGVMVNYSVRNKAEDVTVFWSWSDPPKLWPLPAPKPEEVSTIEVGSAGTTAPNNPQARSPLRILTRQVAAAFAPDGDLRLIGVDSVREGYGILTNVATNFQAGFGRSHSNVVDATMAPGGRYFSVPSQMMTDAVVPLLKGISVQLRSTEDGRQVSEVSDPGRFSVDGESFLSVRPQLVRRWDVGTGRETLRVLSETKVLDVIDAPGGRYLAIIGEDRSIQLVDAGHPLERLRIAVAKVYKSALTADGSVLQLHQEGQVQLVDVPRGRVLARVPNATEMVTASGGKRTAGPFGLYSDFSKQPVRGLFDLSAGGQLLWKATDLEDAVFSLDGQLVIFSHKDGTITAVAAQDGRVLWRTRPEARKEQVVQKVYISDDGRFVLAPQWEAGPDPPMTVLSAQDGKVVSQSLAILPVSGNTKVVDAATAEIARKFRPPSTLKDIDALALLPDGRRLTMLAGNRTSTFMGGAFYTELAAFVWDVETGHRLGRVPHGDDRATDYSGTLKEEEKEALFPAFLSADGRRLAGTLYPSRLAVWTVNPDYVQKTAAIWDMEASAPRQLMRWPGSDVTGVSRDGNWALLEQDRTLAVWKTSPAELPRIACERLKRSLTPDEWKAHLGSRTFRETCPRAIASP